MKTDWWRWPDLLALSTPATAVVWQALLAHTHQIRLGASAYVALGLSLWLAQLLAIITQSLWSGNEQLRRLRGEYALVVGHRVAILFVLLPLATALLVWLSGTELPSGVVWAAAGIGIVAVYLHLLSIPKNLKVGRSVALSIIGLGCLVAIACLPVFSGFRLVLSVLIVATMAHVAAAVLAPNLMLGLPKALFASLLLALLCSVGVHTWISGDHPFMCAETLLLWAVLALRSEFRMTNHGSNRSILSLLLVGWAGLALVDAQGSAPLKVRPALAIAVLLTTTCLWLGNKIGSRKQLSVEHRCALLDGILWAVPLAVWAWIQYR